MQHARSGIAHHRLDLVSHDRLETIHRALGARRLSLLEWALLQAPIGIEQELTALGARRVASMPAAAVEIYHDRDSPAFPGYSRR
jgi:hypothetical protein